MQYPRPLSPHLQIYRPQLTSVLSITHRFTGLVLSFGLIFLVFWLGCLALGPEAYVFGQRVFSTAVFKLCLFGCTFSFYYHLGNGVRHLFWDAGYGFDLRTTYRSGWAVILFALSLTLLTWIFSL